MSKEISNKSVNAYRYNCDVCGKEISFKNHTMYQLHIKYSERNTNKMCDLCKSCLDKIRNKYDL